MQNIHIVEAKSSTTVVPIAPNRSGKVSSKRKALIWAAGILLAAVGGGIYWERGTPARATPHASSLPSPAEVSVATATLRDVPIYLTGLGTAQASVTVAIRAQIDGKLQDVLFTEGQSVKKGDVLIKIDPHIYQAAFDQAVAKKAQDQALLIAAEKDLQRFKTLELKDFGTRQSVDNQQGKVDQLKAAIDADQAAIESTQAQLDYTSITAPNDGRVGVRNVDPGNIVHASDNASLVTLTQTHPSAVIFTLPSYNLNDVLDALSRGPVDVTAFDRDNSRALATGTLLLIDDLIDPATSTIKLKAVFPNENDRLWPGAFVNARVLVETRHDALTVPNEVIQRGPNGLFAWVVSDDNVAEMRPMEVGPMSGGLTIVTKGLKAGDRVVVEGQFKLQRGAPVTISTPRPAGATNT